MMGWNPPNPPKPLQSSGRPGGILVVTPPLWKCMCEGCGAPLQRTELECSYCKRATMVEALVSTGCRYEEREIQGWVAAGLLTPNQASELVTK